MGDSPVTGIESAKGEAGSPSVPPAELASAVALHLDNASEVIRCRAAGALAKVGNESVSVQVVAALLDEDPDVRTDAMAALLVCATIDDAESIRHSLIGDPVLEVKLGAIKVLGKLKDRGSVPLLRALAISRCDEDVFWDDSSHAWDDWLDVQLATIETLGLIGDDTCLPELLAARDDEMGQTLDVEVFRALARLGQPGIDALHGFLKDADPAIRRCSLDAVLLISSDNLTPFAEQFAQDPDARLRILAVTRLPVAKELINDIALNDRDCDVRIAAIESLVRGYRVDGSAEIGEQCLNADVNSATADQLVLQQLLVDESDAIRVAALGALMIFNVSDSGDVQRSALKNALLNNFPMPIDCADNFVNILGDEAQELLCALVNDVDRPIESRLSAARSLARLRTPVTLACLASGVIDPLQQIRTACLNTLVSWCNAEIELSNELDVSLRLAAVSILERAIKGQLIDLVVPADPPQQQITDEQNDESYVEGTQEGESPIVGEKSNRGTAADHLVSDKSEQPLQWHDRATGSDSTVLSTLESITRANLDQVQTTSAEPSDADDGADRLRLEKGKRRRVSVDGPEDYAKDLQCVSMILSARVLDQRIDVALHTVLIDADERVLESALRAIVDRSESATISSATVDLLQQRLLDPSASIRYLAARGLVNCSDDGFSLDTLAHDEDALCRALYVSRASIEQAYTGLQDASVTVRHAAVDRLNTLPEPVSTERLVDACIASGARETLGYCFQSSGDFESEFATRLAAANTPPQSIEILLTALASS